MQLLAVQVADEARHIEVFTRRARLRRDTLGVSGAGGRASLQTLLDEPDFTLAGFLLSVLGEGTFLSLLSFLERHAPDPVTRQVARLALQDEARHVAFGLAHVEQAVRDDPVMLGRLRLAVERRHAALASTAGLNQDVFDALVVLAAGASSSVSSGGDRRPGSDARRVLRSARATTWTTPAGAGSSGSASRPTRPPRCRPCTPATSCRRSSESPPEPELPAASTIDAAHG